MIEESNSPTEGLTTPTHWDCECPTTPNNPWGFIHPKSEASCSVCGTTQEESPDSRKSEVSAMLKYFNQYCGCDTPVRYFVKKVKGTFYWCGECLGFATVQDVIDCLKIDLEIREYDGPPISCVNGELMTPDNPSEPEPEKVTPEELRKQELCKHWETDGDRGICKDGIFFEQSKSCGGLLMNCKNPKYQIDEKEETPMEEKLDDMVNRCLEITEQMKELKDPINPLGQEVTSYDSIEAALEAKELIDNWGKIKSTNIENKRILKAEQTQLHQKIIKILPFRNIWVRVIAGSANDPQQMAVGYRKCDHGGDHNELEIIPWKSDLKKLNDTLPRPHKCGGFDR